MMDILLVIPITAEGIFAVLAGFCIGHRIGYKSGWRNRG